MSSNHVRARLAAAVFAIAPFSSSYADTAPAASWKGQGELGYLRTAGNTDTQSFTAKLGLAYEEAVWRHHGNLEATSKADHGTTTAERYYAAGKSDYKLDAHRYAFGALDYEEDHFSGYDHRVNESVGMGYRLVDQPTFTLDLEAGPGARQSQRDDGVYEREATLRLGANLDWKISSNAALTEELSSTVGEQNTASRSITALTTKINDAFAMKLSYLVKQTSSVPPGFKKTDSETGVTLVYSF